MLPFDILSTDQHQSCLDSIVDKFGRVSAKFLNIASLLTVYLVGFFCGFLVLHIGCDCRYKSSNGPVCSTNDV